MTILGTLVPGIFSYTVIRAGDLKIGKGSNDMIEDVFWEIAYFSDY